MADDLEEIILEVLERTKAVVAPIFERRTHSALPNEGVFPNFDEMKEIQSAAGSPELTDLGGRLASLLPVEQSKLLGPTERLSQAVIEKVVAAAACPNLFQQQQTPTTIATAIREFGVGRATALSVTFLRGIFPEGRMFIDGNLLLPAGGLDSFWLGSQVPWGTMVPRGFPHALLLREAHLNLGAGGQEIAEREPAADVLQSIRLASTSHVYMLGAIQRGVVFDPISPGHGQQGMSPGTRWWLPPHSKFREGTMVFTPQHAAEVDFLLPFVRDVDSAIAVAIRRFDIAMNRPEEKDRLVDLAISAESLLLSKDEKEIITYRLRMRGARLLSPPQERVSVSRWLREIYGMRSSIVHGDRSMSSDRNEDIDRFSEMVRNLIRRCARLAQAGRTDFPKLLDEALLGVTEAVALVDSPPPPDPPTRKLAENDVFFGRVPSKAIEPTKPEHSSK